jgi:cobalt/nickel transport system permease protein
MPAPELLSQAQPPPRVGVRIVLIAVWTFLIALWPARAWAWQGISAAAALVLTVRLRLAWRGVLRRLAVLWLFAGLVTLGWLALPDWPARAGTLLLKSTLSLWAMSLLVRSATLPELIGGLRWLRVPRLWTESLAFWGRYYSVLAAEWRRLQQARQARTFARSRRREWRGLAHTLGLLFIRAYERAEQVHRAMLARGYREGGASV